MTVLWRAAMAIGLLLGGTALHARAEGPIGVDAALNPQGTGTPPAGTPQPLAIGQPIVFNERVATSASGQTQILFRDGSTLSVGPDSDLVVDQFVYDPNAGAGKLAMSATRGVFRFVGGRVSKLGGEPVTLRTPAGVIGIQGGIFLATITTGGSLTAVFVYGTQLTVTARNGVTAAVRRPGFAVTVDGPQANPSAPFPAPRGLLAGLVGQFEGPPGMGAAASAIDARLAANPALSALAANLALPNLPVFAGRDIGNIALPRSLLGSLPFDATLAIGTVAPLENPRLRQIIEAIERLRQRTN